MTKTNGFSKNVWLIMMVIPANQQLQSQFAF